MEWKTSQLSLENYLCVWKLVLSISFWNWKLCPEQKGGVYRFCRTRNKWTNGWIENKTKQWALVFVEKFCSLGVTLTQEFCSCKCQGSRELQTQFPNLGFWSSVQNLFEAESYLTIALPGHLMSSGLCDWSSPNTYFYSSALCCIWHLIPCDIQARLEHRVPHPGA